MEIDYLHNQLHKIIERVRGEERLILGMGSANNVKLMANYLKCFDIKIEGILDNNSALSGSWQQGHKTYKPENALLPFKPKVLVMVYSPKYSVQMKAQLESYGYVEGEHFFLIDDFRYGKHGKDLFEEKIKEVKEGIKIYEDIMEKYGCNGTHVFIVRGATGDVFLNGLYLKEYRISKDIDNYVLVGNAKGLRKIAALFGIMNVVELSFEQTNMLGQCCKFLDLDHITNLFMWHESLYFNRCQTRMHPRFSFIDTYTYYIYNNLSGRKKWEKPAFLQLNNALREKYDSLGIVPGKTIIVSPFAYSVKKLPIWFWDDLAKEAAIYGYEVLVNINEEAELNPFDNMKAVFFSYHEAEAILQYAGHFLALRSGLCDIVSMVRGCRQVILYPTLENPVDYKVHRADGLFSGFDAMGFDTEYITEISSKLIQDIRSTDRVFKLKEKVKLFDDLKKNILGHFKLWA